MQPPPSQASPGSLRILVVDDEVEIVELLGEYLRARRHHVEVAFDGQTGIALARERRFDVVLTDMKLPKASGLEVLDAALGADPQPGVIVMTGFGTVETATRALSSGASDYLLKPFRLRDVHATILKASQRAAAARRTRRAPDLLAFHEACLRVDTSDEFDAILPRLHELATLEADGDVAVWLRRPDGWTSGWAAPPELEALDPNRVTPGLTDGRVVACGGAPHAVCLVARPISQATPEHAHRLTLLARAVAAALSRSTAR